MSGPTPAPAARLRAVVTGATGAIGRCVVGELLSSPAWERVTVIGRCVVAAVASVGDLTLSRLLLARTAPVSDRRRVQTMGIYFFIKVLLVQTPSGCAD